ncbi:histidine phosphatase family protein [Actinokineospora guangxiensis]|uniref:Histidine phosphatase family protein n=1 Tax=Actinokineospora guangxiensis TaxID=1490288 RepID=A0ABW0ERP5_9PSEU
MSTNRPATGPTSPSTLVLITHLPTAATRAAAFPADEPLLPADRAAPPRTVDAAVRGPELRCAQTAALFGFDAAPDAALRDLDAGAWRGLPLDRVPADGLAAWLADPAERAPGGESVACVVARVGGWLDRPLPARRVAAVTHPAVVRAALVHALGAPARAFWRIDAAPGSHLVLRGGPGRWTAHFR